MDQNFIRAAFMSLDDIEKVENKVIKQALKESREKEKQIRIMGDPGKGVEIFNRNMQIGDGSSAIEEDFDVDELANKYIGQIVSIKLTYSKFKNYIGEITNIVQFNKTFEDSVWEVYLNVGKEIQIPGKYIDLDVKEEDFKKIKLEDKLEEDRVPSSRERDLQIIDNLIAQVNNGSIFSESIKESVEKETNKFNLKDEQDIQKAKEIHDEEPDKKDDLVIVHPLDGVSNVEIGNAIITCRNCKDIQFIKKEELEMTDEKDQDKFVCNLDTQCKHCGAKKGFLYNGDVSSPQSAEAKAIETENDSQSTLDNLPLEPINDEEEPEEIVEESFDKLVNQYLNKIYENVSTYKTTSVSQTSKNSYLFEGVLSFNNNDKQINTSFLLERVKTPSKKYLFKGGNSQLIESAKPFRFIAKVKDKALYFENLRYRYTEKIDNDSYLVEGIEKN